MTPARPPQAHRSEVPLDTLGKLADRRHRLFGWCLRCSASYRPALGLANWRSAFDIDVGALVAERERACEIVGMVAVTCPRCGSRRTELRILPPKTGDRMEVHSANNGRGA